MGQDLFRICSTEKWGVVHLYIGDAPKPFQVTRVDVTTGRVVVEFEPSKAVRETNPPTINRPFVLARQQGDALFPVAGLRGIGHHFEKLYRTPTRWGRIKQWFRHLPFGFHTERFFLNGRQFICVWFLGRHWWEVWEWPLDEAVVDCEQWLNEIQSPGDRYARLMRSATRLTKTSSAWEALMFAHKERT